MEMVKDLTGLLEKTRLVSAKQGLPMIQEYIPGRRNHSQSSFRLVVDKGGALKVCFCTRRLLNLLRLGSNHTKAQELSPPGPYLEVVTKLIREIGFWGGVSMATKVDPRDGLSKLMEINVRFGNKALAYDGAWYQCTFDVYTDRQGRKGSKCKRLPHGDHLY